MQIILGESSIMCIRKKRFVGLLFLGVFIFLSVPLCLAQKSYKEIELYRSLVDKETRDSSYYKMLGDQHTLSIPAPSTVLQKQLLAIIAMPQNRVAEVTLKTKALDELAKESARKGELATELSALSEAFSLAFWHEPKNYNTAFVLAVKLKNKLKGVDDSQFSGRRKAYVKLGEAYYIFKDYPKSLELLENVIGEVPLSFEDCSQLEALRISGICYANTPNMMNRSDSCFMAMMQFPHIVRNRPVYDALALSNLGCNAMMRGEFEKALALDMEVMPRLKQEKDYGHIAGMYACQGFCFLGMGDYPNMRMVVDSILRYAHKDHYNQNKRLKQAYTLNGKYYSAVGDARTAQLYNDSLVAMYKSEESKYTSQFISNAIREVKDQEINLNMQQIARQKSLILYVLIFLAVILAGMIIIVRLYRKRNAAYKALARKAEEWARNSSTPTAPNSGFEIKSDNPKDTATDEDKHIMLLVEQELTAKYTYRQTGLTIDSLADHLGIRRQSLSRAVNRVMGVNFQQYINGYRIREAVRLITQNGHKDLYIDELYERVGFSSRTSFYRVFKQFTDLSPTEFQNNHAIGEKNNTFSE